MVAIPRLTEIPSLKDYSEEEKSVAAAQCPAVARYLNILERRPNGLSESLRLKRHLNWLRCALATVHRKSEPESIVYFWSKTADELLAQAWAGCGLNTSGVSLLSLGKLGSEELNLSSDVDLVYISDNPVEPATLKSLRDFHSLIAGVSELGFCFRIDTDLRPGGRLGPLVSSYSQLEDYYWTQAATWERLALVRLRALAGPATLRMKIEELARRFTYRKYSDYAFFDELKGLRKKIHSYASLNTDSSINIKLDPGGIRDIELFIHSLQVIHGGKIGSLRTHRITEAIAELEKLKLLPGEDARFLYDTYWSLRDLENHLQIVDDQQTYIFSTDKNPVFPLDLTGPLSQQMNQADRLVTSLLGEYPHHQETIPTSYDEQVQWLEGQGFSSEAVATIWPQLIGYEVKSKSFDRDESLRRQFLYRFLTEVAQKSSDKDLGLKQLSEFIRSTRSKNSFYMLLLREEKLRQELATLFGHSPYLGGLIVSRPELLDSFILKSQQTFSDDLEELLEQLVETRQMTELVAASRFLTHLQTEDLSQALSESADLVTGALLSYYERSLGVEPMDILALGKWGGKDLGLRSDLDLVYLTSKTPTRDQLKVAQRFVARLTEAHRGGNIYAIDLRLRPSGSAGPIILGVENLAEYLRLNAKPWERQSYLRSRCVRSPTLEFAKMAAERGLTDGEIKELAEIRKKLLKPLNNEFFDLKLAPGGLADVELSTQSIVLFHKLDVKDSSTKALAEAAEQIHPQFRTVISNYQFVRLIEQAHRIFSESGGSIVKIKSQPFHRVCLLLKKSETDLSDQLRSALSENANLLKVLDPTKRA